ncbi:aprataxin and PNK-like factor [Cochliomyia hominivorax]
MSEQVSVLVASNLSEKSTENKVSSTSDPVDKDERPSCKFGKQCFRKNPRHRLEMAHPGDPDYILPDMPEPNKNAPDCQYGRKCYRLNPEHFKNFKHPRNINIQQNYRKYCLKRNGTRRNSDSSFEYEFSDEDPFAGDSDGSDYEPSDDD